MNTLIDMTVPYKIPEAGVIRSLRVIQPPRAYKWRISFSAVPKTGRFIFMRFARPTDRKVKGAESRSRFYVIKVLICGSFIFRPFFILVSLR